MAPTHTVTAHCSRQIYASLQKRRASREANSQTRPELPLPPSTSTDRGMALTPAAGFQRPAEKRRSSGATSEQRRPAVSLLFDLLS